MSSYGKWVSAVTLVALSLGCQRSEGPSPGGAASMAASQALPPLPTDTLQARAETALRERRYYAPVGDSAIDHYLALRDRAPGDRGVAAALTELQPYLLIAAEQALTTGDLDQAQRLLGLLARVDSDAPALPRLRDGLRRAHLAQQARAKADEDASLAAVESARVADAARKRVAATAMETAGKADDGSARIAASTAAAAVPAPRLPTTVVEPVAVARTPLVPRAIATAMPTPTEPRATPRLLKDAAPRYPLSALNRRIEGSVQVAFSIEPDGSVAGLRLVSATPSGLFEDAAMAAVARWRFEATGRRVDMQRTLDFRLPKG